MRDGIDRKAFKADLRALDAEARKARMRAFGSWIRASSGSDKRQTYLGLALSGLGIALIIPSFFLASGARALQAIGLLMLATSQWLNWKVIRRARKWREHHPFEDWRRLAG